MMKKIMFLFEYFCSPIWIYENSNNMSDVQNISVSDLSISEKLKKEIESLDEIFQSTYNDEYPAEPIQLDLKDELNFCKRVINSAFNLSEELSTRYIFLFDDKRWINRINEIESILLL